MAAMEKILIIDDHPVVLDGITLILSDLMQNAQFFTALDGAQACELIASHGDIDWIFLDVNLPDGDGIELMKVFETMKVTANIVVLSSDNSPDVVDRSLKQHASGFLSKSFDRNELQSCIHAIESGKCSWRRNTNVH